MRLLADRLWFADRCLSSCRAILACLPFWWSSASGVFVWVREAQAVIRAAGRRGPSQGHRHREAGNCARGASPQSWTSAVPSKFPAWKKKCQNAAMTSSRRDPIADPRRLHCALADGADGRARCHRHGPRQEWGADGALWSQWIALACTSTTQTRVSDGIPELMSPCDSTGSPLA